MGLKVRLRYSAGERLLALPERDASKPLLIGRAPDAVLRLPAGENDIAPHHCFLFVHEGQWFVEPKDGAVTLNGSPVESGVGIMPGDVLGLGSSGTVSLEIDPAESAAPPAAAAPKPAAIKTPAAAKKPSAAVAKEASAVAAKEPSAAPSPKRPAEPTKAAKPPKAARPEAPPADPPEKSTDPSSTKSGEKPAKSDSPEKYSPAAPPRAARRKASPWPMLVAVVIGGVGLVWVGMYAHGKMKHSNRIIVVTIPDDTGAGPSKTSAQPAPPRKLFDLNADQAAARRVTNPTPSVAARMTPKLATETQTDSPAAATPVASLSTVQAAPAAPAVDPDDESAFDDAAAARAHATGDDGAWNDILNAHHDVRHQGVAIVKFDEIRRDKPGKFTKELDRFTDAAVNWLYWQRVALLYTQQNALAAQIRQKNKDIILQPAGAFHDQLVKDAADLQVSLNQNKQILADDMGYTHDEAPDLENPTELRRLREIRDPLKFKDFERRVLKYVRENHGGVWWDGQ